MRTRRWAGRVTLLAAATLAACSEEPRADLASITQATVDPNGLERKLIVGYQGWFGAPGDGSQIDRWVHWSPGVEPRADNVTFEMWPEMSELGADERFDTGFTHKDGSPAQLYSAYKEETVLRHVRWMRDYGIDGLMLQRFSNGLGDPAHRDQKDTVTRHVKKGAEQYGRVFAIMYDISGDHSSLVDTLSRDWRHLVEDLHVTESDRYIKHRGKPLVIIWGFGFPDRPGTIEEANRVIDFFRGEGVSLMAGVPADWRRGGEGVKPGFLPVFERFDVISPWTVGAYHNDADIDFHVSHRLTGDLSHTRQRGLDYMPVVFPGFSWANLVPGSQLNMIPRRGGKHLWKQLYAFQKAGCTMMYGAMFDEVDEGTALFKVVARSADLPAQGRFLALDADGQQLPSDWYLKVIAEGSRMLRREISLTPNLPISPGQPPPPPPPGPGGHDAAFVGQDVPSRVEPGAAFQARLTLRNSGGTRWTSAEGYRLGSQQPQDSQTWGRGRVELPGDVAPGGSVTFVLELTAPSAPGRHAFAWRMVQEHVAWFGQTSPTVWIDVGSSGGEEPPPPPPATGTPEEIKVTHGYRGILGREPDSGGLEAYSKALASGGLTVQSFCKALWTSGEFTQNRAHLGPEQLAAELYKGILGREADPGGLAVTADAIRAGRGAERAADMIQSTEFAESFLP